MRACVQALVEDILPDFYTPRLDGVVASGFMFGELSRQRSPAVADKLSQLGLDVSFQVPKWYI